MELSLKNREWKEFLFPEIFSIKKGFYNKKPTSSNNGKIPFLGATANNNGITEFYTISEIENNSKIGYGNNEELNRKIFKGNCIAVTNNGSVGHAYFQAVDFTCSHDINPLYLKKYTLNKTLAQFLIATIEKQKVCFEYARKWRPIRMVKSKILLPVNSQGKPDYEFMENYMRAKEQEKANAYKNYIQKRISELENAKEVVPLSEKDWEAFAISEIFNINAGKRLTKADMKKGKKPFIGATEYNNGITEYISNTNSSEDFNVLGVNYNGSVVENFYHPYTALFSDDVKRLSYKDIEGNKHLYLFAKTQILKQKSKYQYGYKFNGTRMDKQKIMLPINDNHKPDFEYMKNYMKQLELEKLKKYLEYKTIDKDK